MIDLKIKDLNEDKISSILTATIAPRPVAFVTTLNLDQTVNAAPFSFFNIISYQPALISLSILKNKGKLKDTAINILREKEFVIHVVTKDIIEDVNQTSTTLKYGDSEIRLTNFKLIKSNNINTPSVENSKARFEIKLYNYLELPSSTLIIGEIISIHLDNNIYQNEFILYDKFKLTGRLVGNLFCEVDTIKQVKRPL